MTSRCFERPIMADVLLFPMSAALKVLRMSRTADTLIRLNSFTHLASA